MKLKPYELPTPFGVSVQCQATEEHLYFQYVVTGPTQSLQLSLEKPPLRELKLWEHTTFELFVRRHGDVGYWEYNFSCNKSWNCFHFSDYRQDMKEETSVTPPEIELKNNLYELKLNVLLKKSDKNYDDSHLALSTILLDVSGKRHFFAGYHPADKPDFHHKKNFKIHFQGDAFCFN